MIQKYSVSFTTTSLGAALVYAGLKVRGKIVAMRYNRGDMDTGAVLTIIGETTGLPIYAKTAMGTADLSLFPRVACVKAADGAASTISEACPIVVDERISVTVASGGDAKSGSIDFFVEESAW